MIARLGLSTVAAVALVALITPPAWACPVCFGASDSAMAVGTNYAVLVLLGITGGVLLGFVAFFAHLFKQARTSLGEPERRGGRTSAEGGS